MVAKNFCAFVLLLSLVWSDGDTGASTALRSNDLSFISMNVIKKHYFGNGLDLQMISTNHRFTCYAACLQNHLCNAINILFLNDGSVRCGLMMVGNVYDKRILIQQTMHNAYYMKNVFCEREPCGDNGICVPEADSFSCACLNGYTGKYCEHREL